MTSLGRETGEEQNLDAFATALADNFTDVYDRTPVATSPAALGLDNARLGVA